MAQEIEGVLEAALYASDLDAAEHFYGTVLGLERIARHDDRHIFFRCGQTVVLIFNAEETVKAAPPGALPVPPHGATGAGHLCFRVSGDRLDDMVAKLTAAGVAIEADFRWPTGARSIYFRDPAGNSLECAEPKLWNL
ncbi:VOC family protein [Rhizobium rosettiformans]|uniref:VOC family protein n=1 Tax=Rhizobium rosettiformans TaxID=1368430 RepID=UPI00285FAEC3|nr:VOC family protein [Rhizobium rosettiformans]MDR7028280.1 catechol 2,3-dioxygenase-like lactoylglutathione lyase family enzyme [Rhizobium rosettiformans]MDR7064438.1 catechol 2,3-dioxygenase-like lactoylglutathione lyase family enzyme [Rhizobium rosettiformans]